MDKKFLGLFGAVAGLATMSAAQAATNPVARTPEPQQPASYADLLAPIPDAAALLQAEDAARLQERPAAEAQPVQYYYYYGPPYGYYHHHHHHHHNFFVPFFHHHHHHHHNHHHAADFTVRAARGGVNKA